MAALPPDFLRIPIAHRGLHGGGVPENSLASARAAIEAGFGIEIDIQPAADGHPMVFHDYDLTRLVGDELFIADLDLEDIEEKRLLDSDEGIPTLTQMLELVSGQVPLLIEIKDQDGRLGRNIGNLHQSVAARLTDYRGPLAVMSFNPHIVRAIGEVLPDLPVGLVTCGFPAKDWPELDARTRQSLAEISQFDASGASFISHDRCDLDNPRVDALKARGVPILCWTVRSAEQQTAARQIADNITFEGYLPAK